MHGNYHKVVGTSSVAGTSSMAGFSNASHICNSKLEKSMAGSAMVRVGCLETSPKP